jgi:hypothetical protein
MNGYLPDISNALLCASVTKGAAGDLLELRRVPKGKIIAPIGGHFAYYGIWDEVELLERPSVYVDDVVIWSLENEILHCGAALYNADVEKRRAAEGTRVKGLDPTRLITLEADLDPGGVADVIGLHYAHEMPEHPDYSNTADWLSRTVTTGTRGGLMGTRGEDFKWKRAKPLYVGEYLWVPYDDASPRDRNLYFQGIGFRREGNRPRKIRNR